MPVDHCIGFTPCPVFDAQDLTDIATNPLPLLWRTLPDDAQHLYQFLSARIEAAGFTVREKRLRPGRQGSTSPTKVITLADNLDSRNRVMVLLHELAHGLEHFRDERLGAHRIQVELEAESASAVVCAMLGLEHPSARDYILSYHGSADDLKASLGAVKRIVGQTVTLLGLDDLDEDRSLALIG